MIRFVSFILFAIVCTINCQEVSQSYDFWEPEDINKSLIIHKEKSHRTDEIVDFDKFFLISLINFYKKHISKNSIDRCPFYVSCSNFAAIAIKSKGGIIGLGLTIDRYFYRENSSVFVNYDLKVNNKNKVKADDSFFIYGKNKKFVNSEF